MSYTIIKVMTTSVLIVAISELSKRSSLLGALLASLPLTSVLAMLWLYIDTKDVGNVADLASNIFWLVIPSLVFFISLPVLLKKGLHFYLSMGLSMTVTAGCYFLMIALLTRYGIKL
ncbi:MAG: DUF3147 family protein [Methylococcaceae bacterium]|nr:DUF3147 family protein [Methylococcaceae bacterium]